MNEILDFLLKKKDEKYKYFKIKLIPGINENTILGVRIPILRKYANEIILNKEYNDFIVKLPHLYHEENVLHGIILSSLKDYDFVIKKLDIFLKYVNNWETCDIITPIIFKKNKNKLIENIKKWIYSNHIYTIRFGIKMLMSFFLDEDFNNHYLYLILKIKCNNYYVKMMIAWFLATALIKHWDDTLSILGNNNLDKWIVNKTIQKAKESFRISKEKKCFLNKLKTVINN